MKGDNPLVHRIPVKDSSGRVIGEKEVVAYRGLLDMVHKERLSDISTELIQAPTKDNGETAIVSASVTTSRGTFSGIGDANPRNVNAKVAPHIIRMAETRAEARAMRKAVNIGVVAMEELGDDLDDSLTYEGTLQPPASNGQQGHGAPTAPASTTAVPPAQGRVCQIFCVNGLWIIFRTLGELDSIRILNGELGEDFRPTWNRICP